MDFQNFWFSSGAAGGGGGDPGDPIADSLRFRTTASWLRKTDFTGTLNTTYTLSMWVKIADTAGLRYIYGYGNQAVLYQSQQLFCYQGTGSRLTITSGTSVIRDPAAWYHFVFQSSPGTYRFWINGVLQSTTNRTVTPANDFRIGDWSGQSGVGSSEVYISDVYCIDNQTLQATDFGRFNDNGVWVPVDYDGDADDYGATGFHLTFEDPDDLGADTAPIGATGHTAPNNFTPNGFDTAPVGIFSNMLFSDAVHSSDPDDIDFDSTDQNWSSGAPTSGFDNQTTTFVQTNGTWIFRPDPPIENATRVQVFQTNGSPNQQLFFNSANVGGTYTAQQWTDVHNGAATTINNIAGNFINPSGGNGFAGIRVQINGNPFQVLVDNEGENYDSMQDSPSQNYSTFNSINPPSTGATDDPSDANLTLRGAAGITIGQKPPGETIYFEVNTGFVNNGGAWGNWWNVIQILNGQTQDIAGGGNNVAPANILNQGGFAFDISANCFANNVDEAVAISNTNLAADDIIGVQIDDDNITIFINGVASSGVNNRAFANNFDDGMYIYARNAASASNPGEFMHINFGQRPYVARPAALTDDNNLQTQNMPTPTILNGSDHFRALTGTGANILGIAQGTNTNGTNWNPDVNTGFTDGLWWIKNLANSNQHQLVDSVRGATADIKVCPNLTNTNPYQAPTAGDNCIAWCWNAPDAMDQATRESGTIDVTAGQVNQAAGFSILEYEGNTTNGATVAHGLSEPPEFLITIAQDNTNSIIVWSEAAGGSGLLNGNGQLNGSQITGTNNQFVTLSANTSVNDDTCSMYCWHAVPGYSAFGSYIGNGSTTTDGPFIYTGFRPAFVLIKLATANGGNWTLHDSTREPTNPANVEIVPNSAGAQGLNTFTQIDILSNGFKIRGEAGATNQSGQTLVYAAFAENPFGGENTAPANAR